MFDVGFSEILLIGVVALIVLGPQRLPTAARTVGAVLRRARASWAMVRAEVEKEIAADEIKRNVAEAAEARTMFEQSAADLKETTDSVAKSLDERI
jgi:sec-independent protein translocase protein TatB